MWNTAWFRSLLLACVAAGAGCSTEVAVETQPNPAALGQPVDVRLTVENPLECTFSGALATVLVVAEDASFNVLSQGAMTSGIFEEEDELELFCEILENPELLFCEEVVAGDAPEELVDVCCEQPDFADENPEVCQSDRATTPSNEDLRGAFLEIARELGLPVDEILARSGTAPAASSGLTTECTLLFEEPGIAVFECALGDLPPGGSTTAVGTFTPTTAGRYFSLALVDGDAECADDLIEGGTDCDVSFVGVSAMAPATSPAGLAAVVLGLIAVGALAIRARRSSSRR